MSASAALLEGEAVMAAAKTAQEDKARRVWLHAWHDPVAGLRLLSPCMRLADISGDGDSKLLVASSDKKLKVYKGTTLLSENLLLDVPVSICTFYPDTNRPHTPSVAVAAGAFVFIYRNLRPYYKFTLPHLEVDEKEELIWRELHAGSRSLDDAKGALSELRDGGVALSSVSQDILVLEDATAQELVETQRDRQLVRQTVVTCMETLKKDMEEDDAVSMLVVGTESGMLLLLEQSGTAIAQRMQLPSAPVFMAVTGMYSVEYRIVCACRNGNIYSVKNGEVSGAVIELESLPCGLVRIGKSILVGCMSTVIHSFLIKGKKMWSIYCPAPISCMEQLNLSKTRVVKAMLVALANGEVRLYNEKHLIATLSLGEPITAMRSGPYGREEGTLVIAGASGSLTIKMLQRTTKIEGSSQNPGPPPEQDVPLNIPKKTKLYVEQTQREREQATEIHRVFQRDLCKLRLSTARAYVKIITDGQGPMSYSAGSALRLSAQVQGLGPKFKINLSLQNTGNKLVTDFAVTFNYNSLIYKLKKAVFPMPVLVPGLLYKIDAELECIDENGGADAIRVFVCSLRSVLPVLSAVVNMPVSEMLLQAQH